jgi:hypothetical protein
MFQRLAASFALARSSWNVLCTEKKLLIFPVLSGIGCMLVTLSFGLPFLLDPQLLRFLDQEKGGEMPLWAWAVIFAFYFCNYFVIIFCNAALISCALIRFNGGEPTIGDGLSMANKRLPQILAWSLVSATVGLLLKMIENAHEKAGEIISGLLGLAWSVLTFFVVPVLVVEQVGPFEAIRRSTAILRKTWGEALVGNVGLSLFVFLLTLPFIILLVGGIFLCFSAPAAGIPVVVLAVLGLLLVSTISSALNGIYLAALYQYAASGAVPVGFERGTIEQAFTRK